MARKKKTKHSYKKESELCDDLVKLAREKKWRVYPETSDCDLLLVATEETITVNAMPGTQVAIQAKLNANIEVLRQSLPEWYGDQGPHFYAVLVPTASQAFRDIARRLQILVYEMHEPGIYKPLEVLPLRAKFYYPKPLWTPDSELWTPAGVASPKSITQWKIRAIKVCLDALDRGYLTREHLDEGRQYYSLWHKKQWIINTGNKEGRKVRYKLNEEAKPPPPHIQYKEVADQIRKQRLAAKDDL